MNKIQPKSDPKPHKAYKKNPTKLQTESRRTFSLPPSLLPKGSHANLIIKLSYGVM